MRLANRSHGLLTLGEAERDDHAALPPQNRKVNVQAETLVAMRALLVVDMPLDCVVLKP